MTLLDRIRAAVGGGDASAGAWAGASGDTETVRRIVGELEALDPERARFIAAFAYVLSRVAHADLHISSDETAEMEAIVRELGHLPEEQAILVVQIAKSQAQLFGGTENYLVTRELAEIVDEKRRGEILDCLFAVSAADGGISGAEETVVRQVASELGMTHRQYVEARAAWAEHREVLRALGDRPE